MPFSHYAAEDVCAALEVNVTDTRDISNTSTVHGTMQGDDKSMLLIM